MAGYHKYIPDEWSPKNELARKIFKAHRKDMRGQGLDSKLRYIGIGMSVYTLTYPMPPASRKNRDTQHTKLQHKNRFGSIRRSDEQDDDIEVVELESEEAYSFDFIKTLEKISYR